MNRKLHSKPTRMKLKQLNFLGCVIYLSLGICATILTHSNYASSTELYTDQFEDYMFHIDTASLYVYSIQQQYNVKFAPSILMYSSLYFMALVCFLSWIYYARKTDDYVLISGVETTLAENQQVGPILCLSLFAATAMTMMFNMFTGCSNTTLVTVFAAIFVSFFQMYSNNYQNVISDGTDEKQHRFTDLTMFIQRLIPMAVFSVYLAIAYVSYAGSDLRTPATDWMVYGNGSAIIFFFSVLALIQPTYTKMENGEKEKLDANTLYFLATVCLVVITFTSYYVQIERDIDLGLNKFNFNGLYALV